MDKTLYDQFFELESHHWWFVARREIILRQIRANLPQKANNSVLDVGCGTGIMLEYLKEFGDVRGMDFSADAVNYSNLRLKGAVEVKQGGLTGKLPYKENTFNLITLLDVIEHIDDDRKALKAAFRILKPGGTLVCTVPAYMFLWSGHDVLNHHKRRYTSRELGEKVAGAGFRIEKITYFNSLLSPAVFLARCLVPASKRLEPKSDFKTYAGPINSTLKNIFLLEKNLLNFLSFPFGVSLLCVAKKGAVK
ncbi:MAG: class I SAM-dependent methyltransferase [Deltaproteobacteria bacterium]|nr:class I SAM-dependent methyltransferase [Deltaproteobacteria bacterium]